MDFETNSDLYLSDIDKLPSKIESAVAKLQATLPDIKAVESPIKVKLAVVKVLTTGLTVPPNGELAVNDLFPKPPKRISRLQDVDLFARKPSNRNKHSSSQRKQTSKIKHGKDYHNRVPLNHGREKKSSHEVLSTAVRKAKERIRQQNQARRIKEIVALNQRPARQPKPKPTTTIVSNEPRPVFARLGGYRIP